MVTFLLQGKDPSGDFIKRQHRAAIIPRIGDTIQLWDGTGWQGIKVEDVVLYPDGMTVEVWIELVEGWEPGSLKNLFGAAI